VVEEPVIKKYSVELQKETDDKPKFQNSQMYVRIVSIKIQENKLEEFKKLYLEKIIPALKETEGCRHVFLTESVNEKDEFISVTIWDNKKFADDYESSGKFQELVKELKHTFSQFYLWKMALEKEYSAKIKTTDDMKIETYNLVTGKSFN
jgi:quinol monooxygenase YgiN